MKFPTWLFIPFAIAALLIGVGIGCVVGSFGAALIWIGVLEVGVFGLPIYLNHIKVIELTDNDY